MKQHFGVTVTPSHMFAFSQHVCIFGNTDLREMVSACSEPTSLEVGATSSTETSAAAALQVQSKSSGHTNDDGNAFQLMLS